MLIASRTPLRVSFFGGGTDYPDYFERARGAVIGMAINKYIYISALKLADVVDYQFRISYSKIETVRDAREIAHPVVRTLIQQYGITDPMDITVMSDLPARSGLGSSSSFTVGLLNLIFTMQRQTITKLDLARTAVHVERDLLHENVGVQDQHHAAYGGLNRFDFTRGRVRISPVQMTGPCMAALTGSLFLLYTGLTRFASETLEEQMQSTRSGRADDALAHLLALTDQAVDVLESDDPDTMLQNFGAMLHEGWLTKKRISSKISNPDIDARYDAAMAAGAVGGKLCGAGSGGFLLMLVPPERQARFFDTMRGASVIPVSIDTVGSTIIAG